MHIDAFDSLFEQSQPQTPAPQYAVVPEGRAEVEIKAATVGNLAWKVSDANPDGTCLQLRLSAGRQSSFVFADLPRDRAPLFKALAAALGIASDADGKVTLPPPHELVGRTVTVEIGHYQTRRGETRACVRKWLPASTAAPPVAAPAWEHDDRQEQRQPQKPQRPQTRSRSAPPDIGVDDDIPF